MADLNKYLGGGGKHLKLHEQRDRVREAGDDELREVVREAGSELLNLRTQAMLAQVPDPMRARKVRKLVARINTELSAREKKGA